MFKSEVFACLQINIFITLLSLLLAVSVWRCMHTCPLFTPLFLYTCMHLHFSLQLIRLGFDDETSLAEFKQLTKRVTALRYPPELTIGIKLPPSTTPLSPSAFPVCNARLKRRSTEDLGVDSIFKAPTQIKLLSDLSQSPYCCEYNRLGLGSLNFKVSKNRGPWRLSTLNIPYTVCSRLVSGWVGE